MTLVEYLTNIIKTSQYGNPIYTKSLSKELAVKYGLEQKKADTATAVSIKRIRERNLIPDLKYYQKGVYYPNFLLLLHMLEVGNKIYPTETNSSALGFVFHS